jgi:diguanylate cyclase (GGDEF)-like protein/PAS domain S-box-containing protein
MMGIPLSVLIVEASQNNAAIIIQTLQAAGYETVFERVETAAQMQARLEAKAWDVVISAYRLPKFDGYAALNLLRGTGQDIPFIIVSGVEGEEAIVALIKAGAHDYLMKDDLTHLVPAVERELAQARIRHEQTLANKRLCQLAQAVEYGPVAIMITDANGKIEYVNPKFTALTGYNLEEVRGQTPRLLKSSQTPPEVHKGLWQTILSGKEWHGEFFNRKKDGQCYWESTYISVIRAANGSITHFIAVKEDITDRKESEQSMRLLNLGLEQMAMTDYLTNLYNRRYFMQRGEEEFKRAHRNHAALSLLMLDLDKFKSVNDTYGHDAGDLVLKQVAASLKYNLREIDLLGRIGGEEFAVLMPGTQLKDAVAIAERVRQAIQNQAFLVPGATLTLTTSVGVSTFSQELNGIDDMLKSADLALYRAKASGRNCVRQQETAETAV